MFIFKLKVNDVTHQRIRETGVTESSQDHLDPYDPPDPTPAISQIAPVGLFLPSIHSEYLMGISNDFKAFVTQDEGWISAPILTAGYFNGFWAPNSSNEWSGFE